jgi:hypothetical protein
MREFIVDISLRTVAGRRGQRLEFGNREFARGDDDGAIGRIFRRHLTRDHDRDRHGDQHRRQDHPAPAPQPAGDAEHAQRAMLGRHRLDLGHPLMLGQMRRAIDQ